MRAPALLVLVVRQDLGIACVDLYDQPLEVVWRQLRALRSFKLCRSRWPLGQKRARKVIRPQGGDCEVLGRRSGESIAELSCRIHFFRVGESRSDPLVAAAISQAIRSGIRRAGGIAEGYGAKTQPGPGLPLR